MSAQPKMKQPVSHVVSDVAASEQDKAIATIAIAFANDPMMRWTFSPAAYFKFALPLIRAFGGNAFIHNCADQVADFAAAALWLPPRVEPDHETMGKIFGSLDFSPAREKEGEVVFEQMERFHPKEPHWYLPLIGTDPIHQGKGYGTALMEYAMRRCDRDRMPAYLESSNPVNIPLYERFGFQVIGKIQSGSSPVLTPMFRPAR
jgi:GNAT superfamily N-acetyltransferase